MKLPKTINNSISSLIDEYHESKAEQPRAHMGVSLIGNECERYLWLNFRWAVKPKFPGRILRLFRRGHLEENQIILDLKNIGINVTDQQKRVNFNYHVSGSIDGIIKGGVPEAPKSEHLLEMKTYNDKRFNKLNKEGVEKSDPVYFIQCQVYMDGLGIKRALFYAVNKNTDEIYTERIRLNKEVSQKYITRAQRIAMSDRLPYPISTDPTWYKCKMCNMHSFCHETNLTKEVNCRTCAHSTAKEDNTFYCELHSGVIPIEYQYEGCRSHVLHPDLVPWMSIEDASTEKSCAYEIDGQMALNGEEGVSSLEILEGKTGLIKSVFDGKEVKTTPELKRKAEIDAEFNSAISKEISSIMKDIY
jgi:hypothetical protein